jgi:predicted DNA-binding protein with PD1-like motif
MKVIISDKTNRVLRFDRGEEAVSTLVEYCEENNIKAAWFSMLGATGELILSYYNLETKKYEDHPIKQNLEVVGITGNVGSLNGKLMLHAHGSFSDQNLSTVGGHIKSLTVSATLEVFLIILQGEIIRVFDEDTGLNLMS